MDGGETIDDDGQIPGGRFNPGDGLQNGLVLLGQVTPIPNRFMVKDAVSEVADGMKPFGKIFSGAHAAGHKWESGLQQPGPQDLFIAAIQEAGPEAEVEFGDDAAGC